MTQNSQKPILYGYFRSSASYRVRLMLSWKGIDYDQVPINLLKGEQKSEEFAKINPNKRVPVMVFPDGKILSQSLAIMEYLEQLYPERSAWPSDPWERALANEIVQEIGCDISPLQNPFVAAVAAGDDNEKRVGWSKHWIDRGFASIEKRLEQHAGKYCVGDSVTMADFFLLPQVANARRFNVDISAYPNVSRVCANLESLPEFQKAAPQNQPDAKI